MEDRAGMTPDEFCERVFEVYEKADKLTSAQIISKLKAVHAETLLDYNIVMSRYFTAEANKNLKEAKALVKFSNTKQAKQRPQDKDLI
jgi:hypothetical protein